MFVGAVLTRTKELRWRDGSGLLNTCSWKEPVLEPSLRHSVPIAWIPPDLPLHTREGRWPNMGPKEPWCCRGVGRGGKLPAVAPTANAKCQGLALVSRQRFPHQRSVLQASSPRPVACFSTLLFCIKFIEQDWLILHSSGLLSTAMYQIIPKVIGCIVVCCGQ